MAPRCRKPIYTKTYTNWDELPVNLTVEMVCCLLFLNEKVVQRKLAAGELKGTKIGGKWIIPKEPLRKLCEGGAEV